VIGFCARLLHTLTGYEHELQEQYEFREFNSRSLNSAHGTLKGDLNRRKGRERRN
jgi:hypothetical protein